MTAEVQMSADERAIVCWNCRNEPRMIVFLPNDQGSFLSIYGARCASAPAVLERIAANEREGSGATR